MYPHTLRLLPVTLESWDCVKEKTLCKEDIRSSVRRTVIVKVFFNTENFGFDEDILHFHLSKVSKPYLGSTVGLSHLFTSFTSLLDQSWRYHTSDILCNIIALLLIHQILHRANFELENALLVSLWQKTPIRGPLAP